LSQVVQSAIEELVKQCHWYLQPVHSSLLLIATNRWVVLAADKERVVIANLYSATPFPPRGEHLYYHFLSVLNVHTIERRHPA
jgi:hypothetical protein